ncbi:MAG: class I SAM-dependent methyltransferase [Planctomycetaceae bacterium]|nr:class I SAM-dependent methyltransferase [Planctomycetales bacterium]MCB9874931.1 class I SAM-dependent methyltransferase [Planctomycetaceae bacterium]MCB9923787.1 class I SAM-dependent methyltransferase [Planctomycetaceae bacterium]
MTTAQLKREPLFGEITRKLRRHLAHHGLGNTARRLVRAITSRWREHRLGIVTSGNIAGTEMGFDAVSFGYQPVPYASFDAAMRHVDVRPGVDVFVDFGCGMGRAVILAATYSFRRVIGVERSESLSRIARGNIVRAKSKLRCRDVLVETCDARNYQVPMDATHFFLFNPFDEPVVLNVLDHIRQSVEAHPRKVSIIYALPKCRHDPLPSISWLELKSELETIDSDWQRLAIYETR